MEDLSKLTSKDLEALLAKKREEEHRQALDKRAAYEGIRAELVQKVENKVRSVCDEVKGLHAFCVDEIGAFRQVLAEYGQLRREGQMSFTVQEGCFRIEVRSNKVKRFDERADIAASRLIEFLQQWIEGKDAGSDDPMYQLAMTLLERDGDQLLFLRERQDGRMEETRTVVQPTVKRVKSTTLTPGRWIYVCPCGFRYTVCRVVRTSNKWMVYCFKCKQQTGKYYKVMDERLEFEENFNGKLNCRCFTTIRLHHPVRNAIGAVKQIYLKGIWKGNAKILQASTITLDRINLPMAKLDSGLMPEECRRLIRNLYRNRPGINWEVQQLDYLLLEYINESKEPKLF